MVLFVLNATATTEIYTYGPPLSPHDGLPSYRRHLDGLRGRLGRAMGETARRLSRAGLEPWIEPGGGMFLWARLPDGRSEEHTSELQSLMRISYAVFCLKNKNLLQTTYTSIYHLNQRKTHKTNHRTLNP